MAVLVRGEGIDLRIGRVRTSDRRMLFESVSTRYLDHGRDETSMRLRLSTDLAKT